jgi:murein DD-endopeptidase MepM/ murein hydrolase activator NlpD
MPEKFLHKPITPFKVNQYIGEDRTCIDIATRSKYLTRQENKVCPPGYESYYKYVHLEGHDGTDIEAYDNQPIYSACSGTVNELQTAPERGLGIGIISDRRFHFIEGPFCPEEGDYYASTRYWHLKSFNVKCGDVVTAGQLIGWADNTGYSSGNHLHFELKPMRQDPDGSYHPVFPDNGLNGSIDPARYIADLSAIELNWLVTRIGYYIADILNRSKLTG